LELYSGTSSLWDSSALPKNQPLTWYKVKSVFLANFAKDLAKALLILC